VLSDVVLDLGCCSEGDETMNDTEALKIFESCVNEMYKNSTPPTTWEDIKERYGGTGMAFVNKHSLSEQDYDRIKDKYVVKLNIFYRRQLNWFLLDYAPSFKKEEK